MIRLQIVLRVLFRVDLLTIVVLEIITVGDLRGRYLLYDYVTLLFACCVNAAILQMIVQREIVVRFHGRTASRCLSVLLYLYSHGVHGPPMHILFQLQPAIQFLGQLLAKVEAEAHI